MSVLSYYLIKTEGFSLSILQLLVAIIILVIAKVLLIVLKKVFDSRASLNEQKLGRYRSLYQIFSYFIWIIAILSSIQSIGIKLNVLLAGGAALLVGLGLGLQSLFHDFVSGVIILLEGTIEIDDVIEVDGTIGRVSKINLRNSQIKTLDNYAIIIPNHYFISEKVINWSHEKEAVRFHIDIGVAYGSDTNKVINILEHVPNVMDDVVNKTLTTARFEDFGESSLDFRVYFWTKKPFQIEPLKSKMRLEIDRRFRVEGITIPFPQRDLHLITKS